MRKIIQIGNKMLRETAKDISLKDIKTVKIQKIIQDMKEALVKEADGVGLAAPQIGKSLRIFVISGKALKEKDKEEKVSEDLVFINPAITKQSRKKELMDEGCLSIRGRYGKVTRSSQVTIRAYDENGKRFERGASSLLAQIFQHEVDHLDGILFTDKAEVSKEISKDEWNHRKEIINEQ